MSVDTFQPEIAGLNLDVVGGRLDLVSGSSTSIQWTFLNNNMIRLFNPSTGRWQIVQAASAPTLTNVSNDLNGTALAPNTIYDIFAEYSSATAFTLVASRWATGGDGANNASTAYATPVMTSNNAPGPVVVSARSEVVADGQTYSAFRAFNQTSADYKDAWGSGAAPSSGTPQNLMVDFGQPVCINRYAMQQRNNDTNGFPADWKLQGSNTDNNLNNDTNWDDLDTRSSVSAPAQAAWWPSGTGTTFTNFINNRSYRYYRIRITAISGTIGLAMVANLKLVAAPNSLAGGSSRVRAYETSVIYNAGDRVTYGGHDWVCILQTTAGTTPVAGSYWVDNGTSVSGDFSGLYRHYGVLVSDSSPTGKKRRWLGIIYTYNNAGTVNFKDEETLRYISNFYNMKDSYIFSNNTSSNYTFVNTSLLESNNGAGSVRGRCISCFTQGVVANLNSAAFNTTVGATVQISISKNLTAINYTHLTQAVANYSNSLCGTARTTLYGFNFFAIMESVGANTGNQYTAQMQMNSSLRY